jgi:hypothetical protein
VDVVAEQVGRSTPTDADDDSNPIIAAQTPADGSLSSPRGTTLAW